MGKLIDLSEQVIGGGYYKVDWTGKSGSNRTRNFKTAKDAASFALTLGWNGSDEEELGVHHGRGRGDEFEVCGALLLERDGSISYMAMDG